MLQYYLNAICDGDPDALFLSIESCTKRLMLHTLVKLNLCLQYLYRSNYNCFFIAEQIAALNRSFLELSAGRSSKKKEEEPPKEVIEIWTRKTDGLELETEGLKECRALQERLLNSGIPVTLESLKR